MAYEDEHWLLTTERFVGFWAPRVGIAGAKLKWRIVRLANALIWINPIWGTCLGISDHLHMAAFKLLAVLLIASEWIGLVYFFVTIRAFNRTTSEVLGIRIGAGHAPTPPRQKEKYEKWCSKYGVIAYAAVSYYGKQTAEKKSTASSASVPSTPNTPFATVTGFELANSSRTSAPGWYIDTADRFPQRYYDGTTWTSWVINADGAEVIDPQGAPGDTSNL